MNKKKSFITSTLVTLLVVVMLILSGPAQAVSVVISGVQPSYTQGTSVDFQVQITINDPDRYVPLSNISLDVTGTDSINRTFALDGSPISGNPIINITPVFVPQPGDFGYGYGYGYDSQNGYGYNFGNGSGYGYGYGGGGGEVTYIYNVSINTTSLPTGNYTAIASLNTGKAIKPSFKSAPVTFEITTDTTPPVITNFTADPSTHISRSNPTTMSADVTDINLELIDFMVVDINNLVRGDQTMLFRYTNRSGISGKSMSFPWDGTVLDMISWNGTVRTYITSMYLDDSSVQECQGTVMSPVQFKKNGTAEPVNGWAWFNRSTGNLSSLNLPEGYAEIEDGNSTISVIKLVFANGINQPPVEHISDKTYIIYDIAGDSSYLNPVLVSEPVPDGNYKIKVHAQDTADNHNSRESDIDTLPIVIRMEITPKKINPMRQGVIKATIYNNTPPGFDVESINISTIKFGPDKATVVKNETPEGKLLLFFRTEETGIKCGDTQVNLTGKTYTGIKIFGNDSIQTIECPVAPSGGGDGAGTGGGGVVTSEPFDNIAKSETYEKSLIANTSVTYTFKAPEHGIYEIAVTGKENENDIALRVEALKDTSRLVKEPAPGVVYRNVNVWSGTKRIKEVLIRFKVENSWLSSNSLAGSEVRMVQWREKTWVHLDTLEKNRDDKFTYYEAKTNTLSVFAITGLKGVATAVESYPQVTETSLPAETAETPTEKVPGFGIVLAMVTISALYMLRKGKK